MGGKTVSYDTKPAQERFNRTEYAKLEQAFDFFNRKLFGGKLPDVFFTICRHRGANGYFRPEGFQQRQFDANGDRLPPGFFVHEIALMPDAMYSRPDRDILSTLVHEMCHLRQQEQGKPSRNGYHNRQWADYMKEAGLQPSTFGPFDSRNPYRREPVPEGEQPQEGAETGQNVSHYIIKDGPFDAACAELLASGFSFTLDSMPVVRLKAPKSKFKFTCPHCTAKAWAKAGTKIICGECNEAMEQEEEN